MKFDMHFKNIKNMQFNNQIFKICSHVNLFNERYIRSLQTKRKIPRKFLSNKNFDRDVTCNIGNEIIMKKFQN